MLSKAVALLITWFVLTFAVGLLGGIGPVELMVTFTVSVAVCLGYHQLIRLVRTPTTGGVE